VKRLPYHPVNDFAPIGYVADNPYVLAVKADHPAQDLRGLIELAKREPGKLTYSTGTAPPTWLPPRWRTWRAWR
jgi:tripartite-type tricarboxylate transporter receptor subunit TctC